MCTGFEITSFLILVYIFMVTSIIKTGFAVYPDAHRTVIAIVLMFLTRALIYLNAQFLCYAFKIWRLSGHRLVPRRYDATLHSQKVPFAPNIIFSV
jgi:hypothetical protein